MNKVLVLGDGMMGRKIVELTKWDYNSRKKDGIDFVNIDSYKNLLCGYDIIFNCIGHTDTYDKDREIHWNVNYKGVVDLVDHCNMYGYKLVHISTDYIYSNSVSLATEEDIPVHCKNWYAYTKLIADAYVQLKLKDYLLFRCSFKHYPWLYDNAITTQLGNFDFVEVIAKQMIQLIEKQLCGVYNLGTEVKTIYDLAKRSNPNVIPSDRILNESMPLDITMNLKKFKEYR